MKTYSARESDIQRAWLVVDASGKTLGRLATHVATALRGKHKPMYTPHLDTGDHVVVINAKQIALTGAKNENKKYFRHTLYPGGSYWVTVRDLMEKHPERVVQQAVKGMLPHTKLGRAMFKKLKVYPGPEHPHAAQRPVSWDLP
jgi:large subunit ribosomal protein L13